MQRLSAIEKRKESIGPSSSKEPTKGLGGREMRSALGSYYLIERYYPNQMTFPVVDKTALLTNLRLVRGIGPVTECCLRREGCHDLRKLLEFPQWRDEAVKVLGLINEGKVGKLKLLGAGDFELLAYFEPEDLVFLDIESTGLWASQPLFLVGILYLEKGQLILKQFLARRLHEEKALLEAVLRELDAFRVIVTYNGKKFDVPYIEGRSVEHRFFYKFRHHHLDLLYHARRHFKDRFPDCRLVTLEEHFLGVKREGDIPGYLIPRVYHRFTRTQDPRLIKDVLHHNALDLLTLAKILHIVRPSLGENDLG